MTRLAHPILLSLGSNIDPIENLRRAVEVLAQSVVVVAASPIYRSAPVGAPRTPDFCNAALKLETELPPRELKWDVLRPIEGRLGRVRTLDRNAPRPIDLDLAVYGDSVVDDSERPDGRGLRIPDPDILCFLHVVRPLADLSPEYVHPIAGRKLSEVADELESSAENPLFRCVEMLEP